LLITDTEPKFTFALRVWKRKSNISCWLRPAHARIEKETIQEFMIDKRAWVRMELIPV